MVSVTVRVRVSSGVTLIREFDVSKEYRVVQGTFWYCITTWYKLMVTQVATQ